MTFDTLKLNINETYLWCACVYVEFCFYGIAIDQLAKIICWFFYDSECNWVRLCWLRFMEFFVCMFFFWQFAKLTRLWFRFYMLWNSFKLKKKNRMFFFSWTWVLNVPIIIKARTRIFNGTQLRFFSKDAVPFFPIRKFLIGKSDFFLVQNNILN